jgi:hypothetical protein
MTPLIIVTCVVQIVAGLCVIFGRKTAALIAVWAGVLGSAYAFARFVGWPWLIAWQASPLRDWPSWAHEVGILVAAAPVAIVLFWIVGFADALWSLAVSRSE